jgi:hypothetical protein
VSRWLPSWARREGYVGGMSDRRAGQQIVEGGAQEHEVILGQGRDSGVTGQHRVCTLQCDPEARQLGLARASAS